MNAETVERVNVAGYIVQVRHCFKITGKYTDWLTITPHYLGSGEGQEPLIIDENGALYLAAEYNGRRSLSDARMESRILKVLLDCEVVK